MAINTRWSAYGAGLAVLLLGGVGVYSLAPTGEFNQAYALAWATHTPILALDGTDPDALQEAVARLRTAAATLAADQAPAAQEPVAKHLYPLRFLESLPALQRVRDAFLAKPSEATYTAYRDALRASLSNAESDAHALRAATGAALDTGHTYTFMDGSTSAQQYATAIQSITETFTGQKKAFTAATTCIEGRAWWCPTPIPSSKIPTVAAQTVALSTEAQAIRSLYRQSAYQHQQSEGLVALTHSACIAGTPVYFEVFSDNNGNLTLAPLNDLYFWSNADGLKYQSPTNPYVCIDGARVYARVATMLYVRDHAADPALAAHEVLHEDTVAAYAAHANNPHLAAVWHQQSGYAERVLGAIAKFNRRVVTPQNPEHFSEYLFAARATPLATFFATNPTFIKTLPRIVQSAEPTLPLVSYWQALHTKTLTEDIVRALNYGMAPNEQL